jgi:hypothetical protein
VLHAVHRAYVSPADALWSKSLGDFAENGFARCKGDSHGNSCSAKKKASGDTGAEVLLEISGYWSHAARQCARGPSPRLQHAHDGCIDQLHRCVMTEITP